MLNLPALSIISSCLFVLVGLGLWTRHLTPWHHHPSSSSRECGGTGVVQESADVVDEEGVEDLGYLLFVCKFEGAAKWDPSLC